MLFFITHFYDQKTPLSVADSDLHIRRRGGGHPDSEIRGGPVPKVILV